MKKSKILNVHVKQKTNVRSIKLSAHVFYRTACRIEILVNQLRPLFGEFSLMKKKKEKTHKI